MADMGAASKAAEKQRIAEMNQENSEPVPHASIIVEAPKTAT
jgi:hypothetical protein